MGGTALPLLFIVEQRSQPGISHTHEILINHYTQVSDVERKEARRLFGGVRR
jgi:hypothetical protein